MPQALAHIKVSQFGPWNREAESSHFTFTQFWSIVAFKFYEACHHQWQAPKTWKSKPGTIPFWDKWSRRKKRTTSAKSQHGLFLLLRLPHFAHGGATQVLLECKLQGGGTCPSPITEPVPNTQQVLMTSKRSLALGHLWHTWKGIILNLTILHSTRKMHL